MKASMGLRVRFKKKISSFWLDVDFSIFPGERVGILGRSGIGKSLLLRVISGLEPLEDPQAEIRLGGVDLLPLPTEKRQVGFMTQESALFSALDVLENAVFGLKVRRVSKRQREEEGLGWLDQVGLKAQARASVDLLSGGEKQRVALVRTLIWKPRTLLLDEPFSALDEKMKSQLYSELLRFHKQHPVPMLLVSHDPKEIAALTTARIEIEEKGDLRKIHRF